MRAPPPPTTFVGREREIAEIGDALRAAPVLVTLRGPAGVGKTRLAREILAGEPPQTTACFVDLTEVNDASGLLVAVAGALDVSLRGASSTEDLATAIDREMARAGDLLLVLDNMEHLPDAPPYVARLSERAPRARVLVTSRAPLGIGAERIIDIAPLELPSEGEVDPTRITGTASVRLFADRARASGAPPSALDVDARILSRIVRLLDGVPLAIELCAARTGFLGVAQLETMLERDLLGSGIGPRESSPRQATLRGAIEWSWRLLSDDEKAVLAQASVFRGGFDVDAACAILDLGEDGRARVPALLDALVRSSLLARAQRDDGSARYGSFESVRELAEEKLGSIDARVKLAERHAKTYVEAGSRWAAEADRRGAPGIRRRIAEETENLRAAASFLLARRGESEEAAILALRALLALEPVFALKGPLEPYAAALDDALAALEGRTHPAIARGVFARTRADVARGKLGDSRPGMARAVTAARAAGDGEVEALALGKLGALRVFAGDAAGMSDLDAALALADARGDDWLRAIVQSDRASAESAMGREKTAHALRADAVEVFRRVGDHDRLAILAGYLGASSISLGRYDVGRALCEEALVELRALGDRRTEGHVLGFLARALFGLGDHRAARGAFDAAILAERSFGDRWYEGVYLGWRGDLAFDLGELDAALQDYAAAAVRLEAVSEKGYWAVSLAAAAAVEAVLAARAGGVGLEGAELHARKGLALAEGCALPFRVATELFAAVVTAERARVSESVERAAIELASARAVLARATATDGTGDPVRALSDDVRFAERRLRLAVGTREALFIGPDARWVQREGKEVVELPRQRALRLVLLRLADERERAPGAVVPRDELIAAGWPGERIRAEAAHNRLHVTLSRLKALGLKDVIRADGTAGILLDPEVALLRRR